MINLSKIDLENTYNQIKNNLPKPHVCFTPDTEHVHFDPLRVIPEGFIDLDLPSGTLWYDKNLGATCGSLPSSWTGDYYAYGELEPKSVYSWETYTRHTTGTYSDENKKVFKKYIMKEYADTYWNGNGPVDDKINLDEIDDAATYTNPLWKIPNGELINELIDINNITSRWVTNYNDIEGLNGRLLISKYNNLEIFFPSTGYKMNDLHRSPNHALVTSSTIMHNSPISESSYMNCWNNYGLSASSSGVYGTVQYRCNGLPVRPVLK